MLFFATLCSPPSPSLSPTRRSSDLSVFLVTAFSISSRCRPVAIFAATRATGYPIARVAAKIATGLHLDEIENAVTKKTLRSEERRVGERLGDGGEQRVAKKSISYIG